MASGRRVSVDPTTGKSTFIISEIVKGQISQERRDIIRGRIQPCSHTRGLEGRRWLGHRYQRREWIVEGWGESALLAAAAAAFFSW